MITKPVVYRRGIKTVENALAASAPPGPRCGSLQRSSYSSWTKGEGRGRKKEERVEKGEGIGRWEKIGKGQRREKEGKGKGGEGEGKRTDSFNCISESTLQSFQHHLKTFPLRRSFPDISIQLSLFSGPSSRPNDDYLSRSKKILIDRSIN